MWMSVDNDGDEYDNFIQFIELYYEWMEREYGQIDLISRITEFSDIDYTIDVFIDQFKSELASTIPDVISLQRVRDEVSPKNISSSSNQSFNKITYESDNFISNGVVSIYDLSYYEPSYYEDLDVKLRVKFIKVYVNSYDFIDVGVLSNQISDTSDTYSEISNYNNRITMDRDDILKSLSFNPNYKVIELPEFIFKIKETTIIDPSDGSKSLILQKGKITDVIYDGESSGWTDGIFYVNVDTNKGGVLSIKVENSYITSVSIVSGGDGYTDIKMTDVDFFNNQGAGGYGMHTDYTIAPKSHFTYNLSGSIDTIFTDGYNGYFLTDGVYYVDVVGGNNNGQVIMTVVGGKVIDYSVGYGGGGYTNDTPAEINFLSGYLTGTVVISHTNPVSPQSDFEYDTGIVISYGNIFKIQPDSIVGSGGGTSVVYVSFDNGSTWLNFTTNELNDPRLFIPDEVRTKLNNSVTLRIKVENDLYSFISLTIKILQYHGSTDYQVIDNSNYIIEGNTLRFLNGSDIVTLKSQVVLKVEYTLNREYFSEERASTDETTMPVKARYSNKKQFLKFMKEFYRNKGSEKSYEFIFHAFYNKDVNFFYPKNHLFKSSNNIWVSDTSIRCVPYRDADGVMTNYNNVNYNPVDVVGVVSGTTATVDRYVTHNINGLYAIEYFLSNIQHGKFLSKETVMVYSLGGDEKLQTHIEQLYECAIGVDILNGGSDYPLNRLLDIYISDSGSGQGFSSYISDISNGNVSEVVVVEGGDDYIEGELISFIEDGTFGSGAIAKIEKCFSPVTEYSGEWIQDPSLAAGRFVQFDISDISGSPVWDISYSYYTSIVITNIDIHYNSNLLLLDFNENNGKRFSNYMNMFDLQMNFAYVSNHGNRDGYCHYGLDGLEGYDTPVKGFTIDEIGCLTGMHFGSREWVNPTGLDSHVFGDQSTLSFDDGYLYVKGLGESLSKCNNSPGDDYPDDFTIDFWYKPAKIYIDGATDNYYPTQCTLFSLCSLFDTPHTNKIVLWQECAANTTDIDGLWFRLEVNDASGGTIIFNATDIPIIDYANVNVSPDGWMHISCYINMNTNKCSLHINGVAIAATFEQPFTPFAITSAPFAKNHNEMIYGWGEALEAVTQELGGIIVGSAQKDVDLYNFLQENVINPIDSNTYKRSDINFDGSTSISDVIDLLRHRVSYKHLRYLHELIISPMLLIQEFDKYFANYELTYVEDAFIIGGNIDWDNAPNSTSIILGIPPVTDLCNGIYATVRVSVGKRFEDYNVGGTVSNIKYWDMNPIRTNVTLEDDEWEIDNNILTLWKRSFNSDFVNNTSLIAYTLPDWHTMKIVFNNKSRGSITKVKVIYGGYGYQSSPRAYVSNWTDDYQSVGSGAIFKTIGSNIGSVKNVSVLSIKHSLYTDFGIGYDIAPTFDLSTMGNGKAVINVKTGPLCVREGYFSNRKGYPSADDKIHDGLLWQDYSYVLRCGVVIDKWRDVVKKILHPAGMMMFGEFVLEAEVVDRKDITIASSAILYEIIKNVELTVDNMDAAGKWTRNITLNSSTNLLEMSDELIDINDVLGAAHHDVMYYDNLQFGDEPMTGVQDTTVTLESDTSHTHYTTVDGVDIVDPDHLASDTITMWGTVDSGGGRYGLYKDVNITDIGQIPVVDSDPSDPWSSLTFIALNNKDMFENSMLSYFENDNILGSFFTIYKSRQQSEYYNSSYNWGKFQVVSVKFMDGYVILKVDYIISMGEIPDGEGPRDDTVSELKSDYPNVVEIRWDSRSRGNVESASNNWVGSIANGGDVRDDKFVIRQHKRFHQIPTLGVSTKSLERTKFRFRSGDEYKQLMKYRYTNVDEVLVSPYTNYKVSGVVPGILPRQYTYNKTNVIKSIVDISDRFIDETLWTYYNLKQFNYKYDTVDISELVYDIALEISTDIVHNPPRIKKLKNFLMSKVNGVARWDIDNDGKTTIKDVMKVLRHGADIEKYPVIVENIITPMMRIEEFNHYFNKNLGITDYSDHVWPSSTIEIIESLYERNYHAVLDSEIDILPKILIVTEEDTDTKYNKISGMTYKSIERMKFYNTPQWFKDNDFLNYKINDITNYSHERVNVGHESIMTIYTKDTIPRSNWKVGDLNMIKELRD
jgi:hypothetical protein